MVVEVKIKGLKNGEVVDVHINGREQRFPEEEGKGAQQVNKDTMDERFISVRHAIAAHRTMNEAAQQARRLYWGDETRAVVEAFVHEFDDKGGFLEHTQRQRWTLGGWYSVCKHLLFNIDRQQYNMNNFLNASSLIWGSRGRWNLPDIVNLKKFYEYIAAQAPDSVLKKYQLVQTQEDCKYDFSRLTRPPRIAELKFRKEGTQYDQPLPWTIVAHKERPDAFKGFDGGCFPELEKSRPITSSPATPTGVAEDASSSTDPVVAAPQQGPSHPPVQGMWGVLFSRRI